MKTFTAINRVATVVATTSLAAVTGAATVSATPPDVLFVDQFDERFEDPEYASFIEWACNVDDVTVEVHAKGRVQVSEDGASGFESGVAHVTNDATGAYFVESYHNRFDVESSETIDGDGLLHVEIHEVHNGLATQFRAPGMGVIVRDAGRIQFDISLLIDPSRPPGDEVIDAVENFDARGPHPWAEQGFEPTPEQAIAICGAVGGSPEPA